MQAGPPTIPMEALARSVAQMEAAAVVEAATVEPIETGTEALEV
jgi:hypothetical protein